MKGVPLVSALRPASREVSDTHVPRTVCALPPPFAGDAVYRTDAERRLNISAQPDLTQGMTTSQTASTSSGSFPAGLTPAQLLYPDMETELTTTRRVLVRGLLCYSGNADLADPADTTGLLLAPLICR